MTIKQYTESHAQRLLDEGDASLLWECALAFDQIPTGSMFVVFSKSNPYARAHDTAKRRQWAREAFTQTATS